MNDVDKRWECWKKGRREVYSWLGDIHYVRHVSCDMWQLVQNGNENICDEKDEDHSNLIKNSVSNIC